MFIENWNWRSLAVEFLIKCKQSMQPSPTERRTRNAYLIFQLNPSPWKSIVITSEEMLDDSPTFHDPFSNRKGFQLTNYDLQKCSKLNRSKIKHNMKYYILMKLSTWGYNPHLFENKGFLFCSQGILKKNRGWLQHLLPSTHPSSYFNPYRKASKRSPEQQVRLKD